MNYNTFVTGAVDGYNSTYRDFGNIDYVNLNFEVSNIHWDQVFTLGNSNDQLSFIQENLRRLYDRCVLIKTKLIIPKHQPWFTTEIKKLIEKRDSAYRW